MSKAPKPPINVLLAQPSNMWSRYDTQFEFIVLHYVGAVSTAKNNAEYLHREPNLGWSAHFFVDETSIWQSVDFNHAAGHCGVDYSDGQAPFWNGKGTYSTNRRSIGIEMCCKKDSKGNWFIEPETVTRTVALVKWLMQEFNIHIEHVIRHYDVCWKTCPEPWVRFPEQWEAFKKRLVEPEEEEEMVRFKTIEEMPNWAQKDMQTLVDLGKVKGKGGDKGLDMTEDMIRMAIICGRMCGVLEGG